MPRHKGTPSPLSVRPLLFLFLRDPPVSFTLSFHVPRTALAVLSPPSPRSDQHVEFFASIMFLGAQPLLGQFSDAHFALRSRFRCIQFVSTTLLSFSFLPDTVSDGFPSSLPPSRNSQRRCSVLPAYPRGRPKLP